MIQSSQDKEKRESTSIILTSESFYRNILSFSSLAKILFLGILGIIVYFLLSYVEIFVNSNYFPIIIVLIIIMLFVLWLSIVYTFFSITATKLELTVVKKIFTLLLIMGALTAYFAVVINNKALIFASVVSSFLEQFGIVTNTIPYVQFNFYVFVIPIMEEVAKIFPIIILLGNYTQFIFRKERIQTRLTPSLRTFVLYGAFFGVWFDLFEQFFHYSNLLADNISSQSIVNSLIYTRSVYPLHCVTTMIASLGLGIVFINRRNLRKRLQVFLFILFILLAACLHGLWNYYSISQLDSPSQFAALTTIGITSIGVFAVFVMFLLLYKPKLCGSCNTEHASGSCVELNYDLEEISKNLSKKRKIIPLLQNSYDMIMCSQCQNKTFNGYFCLNCWSFPKLQCNNCNQVLPSYTRICWSCGTDVPTLYAKMTSSSPSFYVNLSVGLTRILGAGMFISFIFAFATLRETIFSIGSLSSMGYIILLLGIILSLIVTIIWYAYSDNKVKSMISSMNLISIAAISIIITGLYLSVFAFLMIITVAQIVMGLIGLTCILLIITASVFYLLKIVKGARLIII